MFKFRGVALASVGLALLAGCAAKGPDTAAVSAMMRKDTAAWVDAYNAGDADKIVAMYADDAVVMPPEVPALTSHEAIKQYLTTDMATNKTTGATFALDTDAVGVSGDLAWHSGAFHVNGSAGTSVATGKYLEVWHQDPKGNWLMIRDIWNMDAPVVAPAPPAEEPKKAPAPKAAAKKKHSKKK